MEIKVLAKKAKRPQGIRKLLKFIKSLESSERIKYKKYTNQNLKYFCVDLNQWIAFEDENIINKKLKRAKIFLTKKCINSNIESILHFIKNIHIIPSHYEIDLAKYADFSVPYFHSTDDREIPETVLYKDKKMFLSQYDKNLFEFLVLVLFDNFDDLVVNDSYVYIDEE